MNLQLIKGLLGAFLYEGVDIDKIDEENCTIYISIPKDSDSFKRTGSIDNAKQYASNIKRILSQLSSQDIKIKYKLKDVYWTKEMGDENFERNKYRLKNLY